MEFDFAIFWQQVISPAFLAGAGISISLAMLSQLGAIILGFFLALGKMSSHPILSGFSNIYVWFFRAIPTLLVLLMLWNGAPQIFPALREEWYSPFIAALIGLALAESAFMAEIIRSALQSVDEGQRLAARALGMSPVQAMVKVIIPQATRVAIPPTGNELIGMVKYTSLASVISLKELLTTAQVGVASTFRYAEYYAAATVYYLAIVSILMVGQNYLEKKFHWTTKAAVAARATKEMAPS